MFLIQNKNNFILENETTKMEENWSHNCDYFNFFVFF